MKIFTAEFALYFSIFAAVISVASGIYTIVVTIRVRKLLNEVKKIGEAL